MTTTKNMFAWLIAARDSIFAVIMSPSSLLVYSYHTKRATPM